MAARGEGRRRRQARPHGGAEARDGSGLSRGARLKRAVLFLLAAALASRPAPAAPPAADGTLLEQTPCPANSIATYEQYVEQLKLHVTQEVASAREEGVRADVPSDWRPLLLPAEEFARRTAYAGCECWRIRYASDGLAVTGFLWKPKDTSHRKLPLIVFNRGGNREFGALRPWFWGGFFDFVARGYVVVASQYRGNDGGEGREEFGGADVHDILNLIPLARSLGYVDLANVFTLGWSRGGMMTMLALKQGLPVNAAAVGGAMLDLRRSLELRPGMREVYRELIPGFAQHPDESLRVRSAVEWPEAISTPLLLLQGGADWRVDPGNNALAMAQKLQTLGKPYELVVYAGDDHGLSRNAADVKARILAWFESHRR